MEAYASVVAAWVVLGFAVLVQVVVADVAAIRAGHVPGAAVGGGHDDFLFRATRAHANTNENLAFFLLASVSAVFAQASPAWAGRLAWVFVLARIAHMGFYYADMRAARSAAFAVGLLGTAGLLLISLATLL